jgi:hypothetical protein
MLVPGVGTAVGRPAASEAVRQAAAAGSTATTAAPVAAPWRAAAAASEPTPVGTRIATNRPRPDSSPKRRVAVDHPVRGAGGADVGELEETLALAVRGRAGDRLLVGAGDDRDLGALGGDRRAARRGRAGRQVDPRGEPAPRRDVRDGAAVVARARGHERVHAGLLAQRTLDGPGRAEHLERGQAEPARLVLQRDAAEPELRRERRQLAQRRRRVAVERGMEARGVAAGPRDGGPVHGRVDYRARRAHAQKRRATPTSVRATVSVEPMSTHSSTSCAPAPAGPKSTVRMPAAAMNAESAQ